MARRHLITGAGSGIGAVLARLLVDRGDEVVAIARSAERAEEIRADVGAVQTLVADLGSPESIESLALPVTLDSVIHSAGVVELGAVADLSVDAWVSQAMVNLIAPAVLTREALRSLRAARGTVVFVNSGAGLFAHPGWSAYAASKHGLKALADSLRAEEGPRGVRVCSVFPGRTATPMQAKVHLQEGKDYDPAVWIDPVTVARAVLGVLDLPEDASVSDLTIRPREGGPVRG
jgi:NAD(P)-dependent dehydrogenase (short-subunit alcohol dehydrogenase family)